MQIKTATHHIESISDRSVTGIFAVHGNVDETQDRSHPGAFSKTFSERKDKFRFLWNHDFFAPPIATIDEVRELRRDELPAKVLGAAPDATGGALVKRTYLDTPRGNEVLAGIKAGAITEMSYGYDAIAFDYEKRSDDEWMIRNLRELKLYDISDVLWGANPATSAVKFGVPLEHIAAQLKHIADKAGARHSETDYQLLDQIAHAIHELGARNMALIDDPKGNDSRAADEARTEFETWIAKQRAQLTFLEL